jgi:MMPL family
MTLWPRPVLGLILALSFVLLLVAFHSIVIAVKAIVVNLLSAGAAFGTLVLAFQEGWLRDVTGIRPSIIEAWAPVMIFAILFGLSMDYHVFILTREASAESCPASPRRRPYGTCHMQTWPDVDQGTHSLSSRAAHASAWSGAQAGAESGVPTNHRTPRARYRSPGFTRVEGRLTMVTTGASRAKPAA